MEHTTLSVQYIMAIFTIFNELPSSVIYVYLETLIKKHIKNK